MSEHPERRCDGALRAQGGGTEAELGHREAQGGIFMGGPASGGVGSV